MVMKGWFASVSHADGERAAADQFDSDPACQGEYNTHKFSWPGADNPGGIENSIKQDWRRGKTCDSRERPALLKGDHYGYR